MSSRDDNPAPERQAFQGLEGAVGRLLEELDRLRSDLEASEARRGELVTMLQGFEEGERDPVEMADRLARLESENADLNDRVTRSREGVERLLARIRFLEDQR